MARVVTLTLTEEELKAVEYAVHTVYVDHIREERDERRGAYLNPVFKQHLELFPKLINKIKELSPKKVFDRSGSRS